MSDNRRSMNRQLEEVSREIARDSRNRHTGDRPFFYRNANNADQLRKWLRGRDYNSYSMGSVDKAGNPMFGLSWEVNPASDWSKWHKVGLVIVTCREERDAVEAIIEEIMHAK